MHLHPICFIRQWNHSIQMHINSFNAGHNTLCWQRDGGDVVNEAAIENSHVTLDCFENEGVYWFWTVSPSGVESRRMRVYIRCESPKQIIDRVLGYTDLDRKSKWAVKILTKLYQDFGSKPSIPLVHYLRDAMDSIENIADYEKEWFFKFIVMAERFTNTVNIAMNSSLMTFPVLTYSGCIQLAVKKEIGHIRRWKLAGKNLDYMPSIYKSTFDSTKPTLIHFPESTLGHIVLIAAGDENNWLNYFVHYQFDEDYMAQFWKETAEALDKVSQVLDDDIELTVHGLDMTHKDKQNWKLERTKTPHDFIVPRPILSDMDRAAFCTAQIPGWELLKATKMPFYVSTREGDLLLLNDFDRLTPISGEKVRLDRARNYVDGNQFFYIQAENGAIVSKLTRHDFQDEFSEDYRQKNQLIEFELYEKRLINALRYYLPEAETYVQDILGRFRTIPAVNIDEIYQYLMMEALRTYEDRENIDKLLFVILEDWNSSFNVDADFFETPIKYFYSTDNFVFPASKKDYLLCVGSMDVDSDNELPHMKYYRSSSMQAIQFQVRNLKHYFMYAIDLQTFHRSGFIYVDAYDHVDPIIYRSRIQYERF